MPIHKTGGEWQWGEHGHKYKTREGAEKQAEAAYAHGYRGDSVTTEMDIAKAIRDGQKESPVRVRNIWLFDLRVTGTGVAYRDSLDEYVYRPPEFYLNDEFLERCQGIPVLFDHPEKGRTNTKEWRSRSVGTLILPYIPTKDDGQHATNEVWSIARIYDDDAAELMLSSHVSTSPAVEFGAPGSLKAAQTKDGSKVLIEGKPDFVDHLAVCKRGVWDKSGAPRGVSTAARNTHDD